MFARIAEDQKVIVVARDGAGRATDAVELECGEIADVAREEIGLNLLRDSELTLQALLFLLLDE